MGDYGSEHLLDCLAVYSITYRSGHFYSDWLALSVLVYRSISLACRVLEYTSSQSLKQRLLVVDHMAEGRQEPLSYSFSQPQGTVAMRLLT